MQGLENYYRIEKAIKYISDNVLTQPSLDEVASFLGLSPFHFQRLFTDWVGISPKKFLEYLTLEFIKGKIFQAQSIDEVSQISGLSSQSRVYDLFTKIEAVTPNEYKLYGKNIEIFYGIHNTIFGLCLIALTERGICGLYFCDENEVAKNLAELKYKWSQSKITQDNFKTEKVIAKIFSKDIKDKKLTLLLKGTNFQIKVWEALLKIPEGSLVTYQTIANEIKQPKAVRAVGTAIGSNSIAYLIPCHRVLRKEAKIDNYRWGTTRKKIIIGYEMQKMNY